MFHATVEPSNKGRVGTLTDVHYSEVVLYWGVSAKNHLFYDICHTKQNTILFFNVYESTSNIVFVSTRKIPQVFEWIDLCTPLVYLLSREFTFNNYNIYIYI